MDWLVARQYVGWTERGDMAEYFVAAIVMAGLGMTIHCVWLLTHPKPLLSSKHYKTADVGSTAHPRVEDATCFTYLLLSCVFALNWLSMHAHSGTLTLGLQGGACGGYELYSALIEIHLLLRGTRRADMLVHHALCFGFIGLTCFAYAATSETDLVCWHLVWDSISRMLVSNVPLNLRHFYRSSLAVNASFALTFLTVRGLEQIALVGDMSSLVRGAIADGAIVPWHDATTGGVVACWAALQVLNCVWIYRVVRQIVRMAMGGRGKDGDEEGARKGKEAQRVSVSDSDDES